MNMFSERVQSTRSAQKDRTQCASPIWTSSGRSCSHRGSALTLQRSQKTQPWGSERGSGGEPGIVPAQLRRDFAVMAAQRNTKVLGIFARLARRDGKPRYLSHLPRVTTYLERALRHPDLTNLRGWYDTNLPAALGAASGRKPGDA